jgi:hypothetical protein
VGGAAWKAPRGTGFATRKERLREEERPVQGTQQAELEERPRTIHLPPLSSPKDVPPQKRSGCKAATRSAASALQVEGARSQSRPRKADTGRGLPPKI